MCTASQDSKLFQPGAGLCFARGLLTDSACGVSGQEPSNIGAVGMLSGPILNHLNLDRLRNQWFLPPGHPGVHSFPIENCFLTGWTVTRSVEMFISV